jgi:chorismate-pyruvate lyase
MTGRPVPGRSAALLPADLARLPAPTRMLLGSEGSTTVLLESLAGVVVSVHVQANRPMTGAELPPRIRGALGVGAADEVVLRNSELRTAAGETVSVNQVAFRADGAPWLAVSVGRTPLGHQLQDRGSLQRRDSLSRGLSTWPADGRPCAFKEYLIHCADGAMIYVHETFSPHLVPLSAKESPA